MSRSIRGSVNRARKWIIDRVRDLRARIAKVIEPKPKPDLAWDIPIDLGLKGAKVLRDLLEVTEIEYLAVAGAAWADCRAYVLYTALDELQKTAMYLMRMRDFFDKPVDPRENAVTRLVFSQVVEEQSARERRLVEVLITVILFTTTNDQNYYRHLLLLEELDGFLGANLDLEEFHGAPSANIESSIDRTFQQIEALTHRLDVTKCWYAAGGLPRRSTLRPGRLLSSVRSTLKVALPIMTSQEKVLVGLSYAGYSDASESIHYSVNPRDFLLRSGQERRNFAALGILIMAILSRCHELLGRPPLPMIDQLNKTMSESQPDELVQLHTVRAVDAGDFVLVYGGHLAEVIETRESRFGYRSYRVQYLAEKMLPQIGDEWVAARFVRILEKRQRVIEGMKRAAAAGELPAEFAEIVQRLDETSPDQLQESIRASMIATWNAGLREWVQDEQQRSRRPTP